MFQAMKFSGVSGGFRSKADFDAVVACTSCFAATKIGRDRSRPMRPDWDSVRDEIMFDCITAKFTQHEELYAILLATGDRTLVEHTKNDAYWGDGGDGSGLNKLGQSLMRLRSALQPLDASARAAVAAAMRDSGVNPLRVATAARATA
jgi:ribA/ribD-fused uncharacterized protein